MTLISSPTFHPIIKLFWFFFLNIFQNPISPVHSSCHCCTEQVLTLMGFLIASSLIQISPALPPSKASTNRRKDSLSKVCKFLQLPWTRKESLSLGTWPKGLHYRVLSPASSPAAPPSNKLYGPFIVNDWEVPITPCFLTFLCFCCSPSVSL